MRTQGYHCGQRYLTKVYPWGLLSYPWGQLWGPSKKAMAQVRASYIIVYRADNFCNYHKIKHNQHRESKFDGSYTFLSHNVKQHVQKQQE